MRPNGTNPGNPPAAVQGWSRVTSMGRWLARRRSPAGARPRLSVVMPVYNAEATLAECLTRLCNSSFGDFEIVLVDDGSTDQTRAIAANFPVRVIPSPGRVGPAAARNLGAGAAEADLIFFVDSDVMVRPDTVSRLVAAFECRDVEGVMGVQAVEMRHRDLVSQYKNLWMRWSYVRKTGDVGLFYTTAAAIRRDAFIRAGGFDQSYGDPSIEDNAFGHKLAQLGIRVRVDPELEVEHVKRYSLAGLLRTDFRRAMSLIRLALRERHHLSTRHTSVPLSYMASVPLATVGVPALLAGVVLAVPVVILAGLAALGATLGLNREFLAAIRASEGWGRTLGAIPLLWSELCVVGVAMGVGAGSYLVGRRY